MQVFYHPKKSCCLHGTMCLFLIMIYPPNVILIKKERKEKKSHIVSLIQDTWKSNSIKIKWNFSKLPLKMCRLVGCLREAVEHGGWTVNLITFFCHPRGKFCLKYNNLLSIPTLLLRIWAFTFEFYIKKWVSRYSYLQVNYRAIVKPSITKVKQHTPLNTF